MLSFAGDAIVALLLIATIGYSILLNRRLSTVRNDREKFEVLVRNLNAASQRAEGAVTNLRVTADDLSRRLEKKVEEARALSDDLTYMIERGDSIADRLANQIRAGRDALKPDFQPEPKQAPKPKPQPRVVDHAVEPVAPAVTLAADGGAASRTAASPSSGPPRPGRACSRRDAASRVCPPRADPRRAARHRSSRRDERGPCRRARGRARQRAVTRRTRSAPRAGCPAPLGAGGEVSSSPHTFGHPCGHGAARPQGERHFRRRRSRAGAGAVEQSGERRAARSDEPGECREGAERDPAAGKPQDTPAAKHAAPNAPAQQQAAAPQQAAPKQAAPPPQAAAPQQQAAAPQAPAPTADATKAAPPADGAKPAQQTAEAPASGAPGAAPPAAKPAMKDPLLLSPAEIEVLQELSQRRTQLDKRAADIDQQQVVLQAAEKRIDDKIAKLQELQKSIQVSVDKENAADDARTQSLVKIYETMKPADAAQILSQLDMPILLQMLSRMKEAKTAPILAAMEPTKAEAITTAMAKRQNPPSVPSPLASAKP